MRGSTVLTCAVAALFLRMPVSAQAPSGAAADTADLTRLSCESGQAYADRDLGALESLTASDFTQIDVRGVQLGRAAWLESVKSRKTDLRIECSDVQVRVYGDAALVTGRWTYSLNRLGERIKTATRWSSFWTREKGGWKRHAFQNTYVNVDADRCAMSAGPQEP